MAEAITDRHVVAPDVTDAHVVLCAKRARQAVVTSDPEDLRSLDPRVELVPL